MFAPLDPADIKAEVIPSNLEFHLMREGGTSECIDIERIKQIHHGQMVWLHLLREEYVHLRVKAQDILGVQPSPTLDHIPGSLRKPWAHISLFNNFVDSLNMTLWLISEGRLCTSSPAESYFIAFPINMWKSLHQLLQVEGINSFTRHGITDSLQIMTGHQLNITQEEQASMRTIRVQGNIFSVFGQATWSNNLAWDHNVIYHLDRLLAHQNRNAYRRILLDTMSHAGQHITSSSSGLSGEVKQHLQDACLAMRINIALPSNSLMARYRGAPGHQDWVTQWNIDEIQKLINVDLSSEDGICVPLCYRDHQRNMDVDQEDQQNPTANIETGTDQPSTAVASPPGATL